LCDEDKSLPEEFLADCELFEQFSKYCPCIYIYIIDYLNITSDLFRYQVFCVLNLVAWESNIIAHNEFLFLNEIYRMTAILSFKRPSFVEE
jgi:hypothetical protein